MKKIIFLFISLFFLGGCGQYNEINKLAFIDGIGIEKQDDTYHLYLAVVKEEKQETAIAMFKLEMDMNNIMKVTKLSREELEEIKKKYNL